MQLYVSAVMLLEQFNLCENEVSKYRFKRLETNNLTGGCHINQIKLKIIDTEQSASRAAGIPKFKTIQYLTVEYPRLLS